MKYFVKQIAPEIQESPFDYISGEAWEEEYIISGNKEYREFTTAKWDSMTEYLSEVEYHLANLLETKNYVNIARTVKYYYDQLTALQALEIGKILLENASAMEEEKNCLVYSAITGRKYAWTTIRGCCQRDYNTLYYPAEWDKKSVEIIETEYFNTGSEYMIHDAENDPEGPDDIDGYCVYIHEWSNDGIRAELCEIIGCEPDELKIYNVSGQHTEYEYQEA